jgi:hypothetical protein
VNLVLKKYKEFLGVLYFPHIEKTDWVIIILLTLITFLRLPIPDRSFDVVNYHLLLQEFGFENNISYNFFPGNIQTYTFPLGDRMFYVFRMLLGYRGGVLLSGLVLILLFLQLKDILIDSEGAKTFFSHKGLFFSLSALFIISTEHIFSTVGIYMIDSLMLPFLLEVLRISIGKKTTPQFALVYSSLMAGLSISIKFTSIVFCAVLLSVILYRYYREISFRVVVSSGLILIFPLVSYLTFNFTQTNNPLFPLYNQYFHSPFTESKDFPLPFFGPDSGTEILTWPVYIFFHPERTNQFPYYSGRLSIGFFIAVAYICFGFFKRKREIASLGLLALGIIYLWTITSGVIRYGLFLELTSGILIVDFILRLFNSDLHLMISRLKLLRIISVRYGNQDKLFQVRPQLVSLVYYNDLRTCFLRCLALGMILASFSQNLYSYYLTVTNRADWSLRPSALDDWQTYVQNVKMIGNDYDPIIYGKEIELKENVSEIDIWIIGIGEIMTGYSKLLNNNIPILNLNYIGATPETQNVFSTLEKELHLKKKNMYMLSYRSLDEVATDLEPYGFYIVSVQDITPTFTYVPLPLKLIKVMLN